MTNKEVKETIKCKYVDAEELNKLLSEAKNSILVFNGGICKAQRIVREMPAADVEEVIHSHWIKDTFCTTGDPYYTCANCGRFARILYPNCPWCRAVMDADRTLEVDEAIREIKMLEDLMEDEKN